MNFKNQKGYLIIEALIAVVIFSFIALSLFFSISYLQISTQKAGFDAEAALLVQEATEIAHNALLPDWAGYDDGVYFPVFDVDQDEWLLFPGEEENLKTRFTRYVELSEVCRDPDTGREVIERPCGGEIDENSRYIDTTVTWAESGEEKEIVTRLLTFKVPDL